MLSILLATILCFQRSAAQESKITLALGHEDLRHRLMERKYHLQLMFLTHSKIDCPLCIQSEDVLNKVNEMLGGHVSMFKLDCANEMPDLKTHCKPEYFSRLPDITFLQPEFRPEKPYYPLDDIRFQLKEYPYTDQLDSSLILKFAEKQLPWYFEMIEKKSRYQAWLESWPLLVKLAYFDDYEEAKDSPSFLRMLSADFKMDLDVAYVQSDLRVHKKKTLVIYVKNSSLIYSGDLNYLDTKKFVLEFLDTHQLLEKIFGNYGYSDRDKQLSSFGELEQIVDGEKELWVAVYVGKSEVKLEQQYRDMKSYFKDFITYYRLNATEIPEGYEIKSVPSIIVYPIHPRNSKQPIVVKPKTKMKVLSEILLSLVSNRSKDTYDYELKKTMNVTLQQGRFPVLWFYESNNALHKLVAITFILHPVFNKSSQVYMQPDPSLDKRQIWNISRVPALFCFGEIDDEKGAHSKWSFEGTFNMRNLKKWFKGIEDTKFAGRYVKQDVHEVNDTDTFIKHCVNISEPCVIGLFEGVREGRLKLLIEQMGTVLGQFREIQFSWMWVDRLCYEDMFYARLGERYNKSDALIYQPQNKKVTLMEDKFSEDALTLLVQKSLTPGNAEWIQLEEDLEFTDAQTCLGLRQQLRKEYMEAKRVKQAERMKKIEEERKREREANRDRVREEREKREELDKIYQSVEQQGKEQAQRDKEEKLKRWRETKQVEETDL